MTGQGDGQAEGQVEGQVDGRVSAQVEGQGDGPGSGQGDGQAGVFPGQVLAALEIPVTRTLIVAGALASRDFQDVHHDAEAARSKGSPDIFMNILTTNGLVGRYLTDRFGPGAVLRRVAIRLGAPNHPGDTLVLTGTVEAVVPDEGGSGEGARDVVTVRVVGANRLGHHVTGTATVVVPSSGGRP